MLFSQIKTASDLRGFIENNPSGSYFFTRKTMKFFGDSMRNFGVRHIGDSVVELFRRRPVKHGLNKSSFWRVSEDGTFAKRDFEAEL